MAIAVFTSLLAILLAGILLMRFRKRWLAAFNLAVTNRISSRFAPRLPGFGINDPLIPLTCSDFRTKQMIVFHGAEFSGIV